MLVKGPLFAWQWIFKFSSHEVPYEFEISLTTVDDAIYSGNFVAISVPTDDLAPLGARSSAGAVMIMLWDHHLKGQ